MRSNYWLAGLPLRRRQETPVSDAVPARPIAVVFGDSIAEGHPARHGRLHPGGEERFAPDWPDDPGQLSYEIGLLAPRWRWVNHGIGSQTTVDLWRRWRRDVLGRTFDLADGRGNRTLPHAATLVLVHCGLNDVFCGVAEPETRRNFTRMARSARDHAITTVFLTMPPYRDAGEAKAAQIERLNAWTLAALPRYKACVVDWYDWAQDLLSPGGLRRDYADKDGVHPTPEGYAALARFIVKRAAVLSEA